MEDDAGEIGRDVGDDVGQQVAVPEKEEGQCGAGNGHGQGRPDTPERDMRKAEKQHDHKTGEPGAAEQDAQAVERIAAVKDLLSNTADQNGEKEVPERQAGKPGQGWREAAETEPAREAQQERAEQQDEEGRHADAPGEGRPAGRL